MSCTDISENEGGNIVKINLSQSEIDQIRKVERVVAKPSVAQVGFLDVPFSITIGPKLVWQYELWADMLKRSFSANRKERQPTYKHVTCCEEWLSFASFLEWVNAEVNYLGKPEGKHLDKDILLKGNKTYHPELCSFVPQELNKLLNDHAKSRGEWPRGVSFHKKEGKFRARVNSFGKEIQLGSFDCPEKAHEAYIIAKEAQVKLAALHYQQQIKPEVFQALMLWRLV